MPSLLEPGNSSLERTLQEYQLPDAYLDGSEATSPWIPYGGPNMYTRYLSFDPRLGQAHTLLRSSVPASIGKHKHRSPITGYTLSGQGSVVVESQICDQRFHALRTRSTA